MTNFKLFLLMANTLLMHSFAEGQTFQKAYGGAGSDGANGIVATNSGYKLIGVLQDTANLTNNIALIETDSLGNMLWSKVYGGNSDDVGKSIAKINNNSYILGCETTSFGNGMSDLLLIKTLNNGDTVWSMAIGGGDNDFMVDIIATNDSAIVAVGITQSFGAGSNDIYLIKTDLDGNLLWTKTFGGNASDVPFSLAQTSDGGYIIGAKTDSYGEGQDDMYIIKTDLNGSTEFTKTFGGSNTEWCYAAIPTPDNGYLLSGFTDSYGVGWNDVYLIKIDSAANIEWEKTYGDSTHHDFIQAIMLTPNGRIIMSGGERYKTIMTNNVGDTIWTRHYGGNNTLFPEIPSGIAYRDNGFAIAGKTRSFSPSSEFYFVKTDTMGNSSCYQKATTTHITTPNSIVNSGGVEGTGGTSISASPEYKAGTISQIEVCDSLYNSINPIKNIGEIVIWPNPVKSILNIDSDDQIISVTVYSLSGELLQTKRHDNIINIESLQNGMYIIEVTTTSSKTFKKIIKQ